MSATRTLLSKMPTVSPPSADPTLEAQVFWVKNRTELIVGVLVVLLALGGFAAFQFYRDRRNSSGAEALVGAQSEQDYKKVIEQFSDTAAGASASVMLSEKQRADKKFTEANATLQKFVEKNPKHQLITTARMAMAANLESLDKPDEALSVYQRVVSEFPKSYNAPIALLSQVHLLKAKNKIEEARRVCEMIMTQYRESAVSGEASRQLRALHPASDGAIPGVRGDPISATSQPAPAPAIPPVSPSKP